MPSPQQNTLVPAFLFPLKIETRFMPSTPSSTEYELWLRILPDEAFLQSHDPTLSESELHSYRSITEINQTTWSELVGQFGAYRAAYLVHLWQLGVVAPAEQDENSTEDFFYQWLPEKFIIYLYETSDRGYTHRIEKNRQDTDKLVIFQDGSDWVTDFDAAVRKGMGFKIKRGDLQGSEAKIVGYYERIIVTGYYRGDDDTSESVTHLKELIANHLYTEGLSFLDHGTPTNNLGDIKSVFSARDEFDALGSYTTLAEGNELSWSATTDFLQQPQGVKLAHALGIPASTFKQVEKATATPSSFSYLLQKLSWFALGGAVLQQLLGQHLSASAHEKIWRHYTQYVRAEGPLAAIKIGDQPYGILPVTEVSEFNHLATADPALAKAYLVLHTLFEEWKKVTQRKDGTIPTLANADVVVASHHFNQQLLRILSMEPCSDDLYVNTQKYKAVRGKIHQRHAWNAKIASPLSTLPLAQVYELLASYDPENAAEPLANIKAIQAELKRLFHTFLSESAFQNEVLHAPILSFQPTAEAYQILDTEQLPLFPEEEELEELEQFIATWKTNSNTDNQQLSYYNGKATLFTDLLFRGFTHALNLYEQTIYFQPTNADLKGSRALKIGKINITANTTTEKTVTAIEIYRSTNGEQFTATNPILVKIPFSATVTGVYVEVDQMVTAGTALFELVNIAERDRLKGELFENMDQMITAYKTVDKEERQQTLNAIFDLNGYRLDAWITSFATARLAAIRQEQPQGIYMGAYGWVENLRRDDLQPVKILNGAYVDESRNDDGGFIHCPTPAQSLTASLFKNSYLNHRNDSSNPYTLHLSSDRIQQSEQLMQGIREDQELEALLGYKLERWLRDADEHELIYKLREQFPLEVNILNQANQGGAVGFTELSVINGLKLLENTDQLANRLLNKINPYLAKLENLLDASADHLLFEAGYQLTQNNLTQSAAAMDAAKGELAPPVTESLKTKINGTGIQHKLIYVLPKTDSAISIDSSKAYLSPAIEAWLHEQLGELSKIGCIVEVLKEENVIETLHVQLSELALSYSDLLYLSDQIVSDGVGELELRIVQKAIQQRGEWSPELSYRITDNAPADSQSLIAALEVLQYTFRLLSSSRPATSADFALGSEEVTEPNWDVLNDIKKRIEQLDDALVTRNDDLSFLAQFNLTEAKRAFLTKTVVTSAVLNAEITTLQDKVAQQLSIYTTLFNEAADERGDFDQIFAPLAEAAKALFGGDFILLPPALVSANVQNHTNSEQQVRLLGSPALQRGFIWGQERIQNWVQELAQVHERTSAFEEWQMVQSVWQEAAEITTTNDFKIVQYPSFDRYPWVGLEEAQIKTLLDSSVYQNIDAYDIPMDDNVIRYYPEGCESHVLIGAKTHNYEGIQYGIVMDEFTEHIPDKSIDTGLSFHYNGPNNEAPQALLLAVSPYGSERNDWSEDALSNIIYDTMDLYKIRLMDLETIDPKYGKILPMTNWLNIPKIN